MASLAEKLKVSPVEHNEIFSQLCDHLQNWNIISVCDSANVSYSTVYFWLDGTTMLPRLDTIIKVAEAIGLKLQLVPIHDKSTSKTSHLSVVK